MTMKRTSTPVTTVAARLRGLHEGRAKESVTCLADSGRSLGQRSLTQGIEESKDVKSRRLLG